MTPSSKTTAYYDGNCPLCRAEIDMYRKQDTDNRIKLIDVSLTDVGLPAGLDSIKAMARFHVMSTNGRLVSGAEAFIEVWRQLPSWRWVAKIAAFRWITLMLELAYRIFLHTRPTLVRIFLMIKRFRRDRFRSN